MLEHPSAPSKFDSPHVWQTSAQVDLATYARQRSGPNHIGFGEGAGEGAEILKLRFSQCF